MTPLVQFGGLASVVSSQEETIATTTTTQSHLPPVFLLGTKSFPSSCLSIITLRLRLIVHRTKSHQTTPLFMGPKKTPQPRSPKGHGRPGRGSSPKKNRGPSSNEPPTIANTRSSSLRKEPPEHYGNHSRKLASPRQDSSTNRILNYDTPPETPRDGLPNTVENTNNTTAEPTLQEPPKLMNTALQVPLDHHDITMPGPSEYQDVTMHHNTSPFGPDARTDGTNSAPMSGPSEAPSTKGKSVMFTPGTSYGGRSTRASQQNREFLYVTVKLSLDDRSLLSLMTRLTLLLHGFKNLNIDFQVCGFDPTAKLPPITEATSLGPKLTQLQQYFHGLYIAKLSWSQWFVSWIPPTAGYTDKDFLVDANAVLSDYDSGMFPKWLQQPFTATAGWIFKTLEHTDLVTLKLFLAQELKDHYDFTGDFALYRKVPFLGNASPAPKSANIRSSGRAVHVDTVDVLCTTLWEKLNRLLKSDLMRKLHNFEWKFIPQFHSRRSPEDQLHLKTSAAKQKLVHNAIATITCDHFLDIDVNLDDKGTTVRRFFLDQRILDNGAAVVLAIDRMDQSTDFIFTSAKEYQEQLAQLVMFGPTYLSRHFDSSAIRKILSVQGVTALEDQYWDDIHQLPRSKFTDSLRDDHMDDRDIRIVIENIPDLHSGNNLKRPSDTAGLDIDEITQSSFNTQGHANKAKQARFGSPAPGTRTAQEVQRLEEERRIQDGKIQLLESQLAQLMQRFSAGPPNTGQGPTHSSLEEQLDETP